MINAKDHSRILYGLALTAEALERNAEAERYYKDAIKTGEKAALAGYGMFLFRRGQTEESIAVLRRANAKDELEKVTRVLANSPANRAIPEPSPVCFELRTLDMTVQNGATGRKYLVETMIAGVAAFDYDNDGEEALFVTALSNETFSLFRNLGNGLFIDLSISSMIPGASLPWSGWANGLFDFNKDGFKDMFTANGNVMDNAELISSRKSRQSNTVLVNRGNEIFRAEIIETGPQEQLKRCRIFRPTS